MRATVVRANFLFFVTIINFLVINVSLVVQTVYADGTKRDTTAARIIGGSSVSSEGVYPWMVNVAVTLGANKTGLCGGSLIDEQWVLSAAHCFHNAQGVKLAASAVHLNIGDYDKFQAGTHERLRNVSEIIVHEQFNSGDSYYTNDIALLKLSEAIQGVALVSLGKYSVIENTQLPGDELRVMGWGASSKNPMQFPAVLREAQVLHIAQSVCKSAYPGISPNAHLCAGYLHGGVDACSGDSGGPLLLHDGGQWVQVGIVSFGNSCAQSFNPGVYTNVSHFVDWIEQKINNAAAMRTSRLSIVSDPSMRLIAGHGDQIPPQNNFSKATALSKGGGGGGALHVSWWLLMVLSFMLNKKIQAYFI